MDKIFKFICYLSLKLKKMIKISENLKILYIMYSNFSAC
jgi:hypothetical protein